MEQVLKNCVILGTMIIFCYFFFGVASTLNNAQILEDAKQYAINKGAMDAENELREGVVEFMFVGGGFSENVIPAIGLDKYQRCFSDVASLRQYDSVSCIPYTKPYDVIVRTYRNNPEYTDVYAQSYNLVVQKHLDKYELGSCK